MSNKCFTLLLIKKSAQCTDMWQKYVIGKKCLLMLLLDFELFCELKILSKCHLLFLERKLMSNV